MSRNNIYVATYVVAMVAASAWAVWCDFASNRHYKPPGEPSQDIRGRIVLSEKEWVLLERYCATHADCVRSDGHHVR